MSFQLLMWAVKAATKARSSSKASLYSEFSGCSTWCFCQAPVPSAGVSVLTVFKYSASAKLIEKTFLTIPVISTQARNPYLMVMWWGNKMGKYHCSAVKFLRSAIIYPSFWETEKCCTVCFPILDCTYRGKCMYMLTEVQTCCCRQICKGKLLFSFCTVCLNL